MTAPPDHAEFRSRFVTAHPDVILLDAKEPHKKFVEKLSRDFLVHGMVPFYAVAEIRTSADSIVQKSGLSKNAEDLLTISKAEEPDQVTDVQTLLHRVHALFMALEFLNICTYSRAAGWNAEKANWFGGPQSTCAQCTALMHCKRIVSCLVETKQTGKPKEWRAISH